MITPDDLPPADCYWIDNEATDGRVVVHSLLGIWQYILRVSRSPTETLDVSVWRVLDDIPREMITADICPERPFRVIGTCLDNGLDGFFVRSFATREEAEEHVGSWPEDEFTPYMIVEASRRWGATRRTRAT